MRAKLTAAVFALLIFLPGCTDQAKIDGLQWEIDALRSQVATLQQRTHALRSSAADSNDTALATKECLNEVRLTTTWMAETIRDLVGDEPSWVRHSSMPSHARTSSNPARWMILGHRSGWLERLPGAKE
jgi:outer membrane murein-binding lipoprotein Lpp